MTELDIPPWQQPETLPETMSPPETPPASAEWLDGGPFVATETVLEAEVAGCGQVPAGPRPLIFRGSGTVNSRNPSVGYAQTLLNRFLAQLDAGSPGCSDTRDTTGDYIRSLRGVLVGLKQMPLTIDCQFGVGTETATKMFQACRGLIRDGKIGERTWPELERLVVGPTPTPAPTPTPTPAPTPGIRVREDAWTLSNANTWHPTLLWYARAVRSLQTRGSTDPRAWLHLANTHGTDDPRAGWPSGARWDSCEHETWHFLSWHRAYLHHFERIVRDEIGRLGGPADWALPFWDYSDGRPDVRRLPPAFRATTLPDGTPNPLRVERRAAGMNGGGELSQEAVDLSALNLIEFTAADGGFGGRPGPVGSHRGGNPGRLELTPHGDVHVGVGGAVQPVGLMSRFETAAQDPIFWLHHANIDRLWEAWLRVRPTNRNPADTAWRNATFTFGTGSTTTTIRAAEMVDPRQGPLGYRYSDMPIVPTPEVLGERPDEVPEFVGEEPRPPELVGATEQEVALGSGPTTATVPITSARGPLAREFEGDQLPPTTRVYLKLENVTATRLQASSVVVYLNIPPGSRPSDHPDRRVGNMPVFGVVEASQRTDRHSGSGISATYEITKVVRALTAAGSWDPTKIQVTFVPIADATGAVGQGDVKVGRVSLFYA